MKKAKMFLVSLLAMFILMACGSNSLSGDYSGTLSFMGMETQIQFNFDGNTVTSYNSNESDEVGTFEVSGNQLTMTFDDFVMKANVSDDKSSFTITNVELPEEANALATGVSSEIFSGVVFTKDE